MRWRMIRFEHWNAAMNMALDEAASDAVRCGHSPPTVRFYGWNPSAVSIGCFQSLEDEVNLEACKALGIEWVRRRTGAGAVYHDREGEITYSVIAPEGMMERDIGKAYRVVCGWIIEALALVGIEAHFEPINDILVGKRKISGSAQTRRGGVFLQHGTLLYDVDPRRMFSVLKVGKTKISDKAIAAFEERVTAVSRLAHISKERMIASLLESFTESKDWEFGTWSAHEMSEARRLAKERYGSDAWNFSR